MVVKEKEIKVKVWELDKWWKKLIYVIGWIAIVLWVFGFLFGIITSWGIGFTKNVQREQLAQQPTQTTDKIKVVEEIARDYHKSHTYSEQDLFVCADMVVDVWNLLKSRGINAKIRAGNMEKDDLDLREVNHAWVIAEVEPFTWLAVETTTGEVVYKDEEDKYYGKAFDFNSPKEFKKFIELRKGTDEVCGEAIRLEEQFNRNYADKPSTSEAYEFKGRVKQKQDDCMEILSELKGLFAA